MTPARREDLNELDRHPAHKVSPTRETLGEEFWSKHTATNSIFSLGDPTSMEPIFVVFIVFATLGVVVYTWLSSRHKERMAMIEKGVSPSEFKSGSLREVFAPNPLSSLKWGMLAMFVGIGLMVGNLLDTAFYLDDSVYPGSMLIFGGLGLILFYFIASRKMKGE